MNQQTSYNKLLALSIGIVYIWFGSLKWFPNVSPAQELAKNTIDVLTFSLIPSHISIMILAFWETLVGILLIANVWRRFVVIIALTHMVLTFSPLLFFPDQVFNNIPFQLTLLGQYIFKNIVIIAGLFILYKQPSTKTELH